MEHAGDPEHSLITRSSDGQMMFLANMLSKMKHDTPMGSRIAEVHSGRSLFTREPRASRDTGERQGTTPSGGLRDGRTRHDQHDAAISARPRHQGDAVDGAETQRSRAGREGPQP